MSETDTTETKKKKSWFLRHKILTVIGVVIVISIIANGGNKDADKTSVNTATKSPAASPTASSAAKVAQPTPTPTPKAPSATAEDKSALSQANTYANTMHMSKQGVYDQLVSQYGGQFTATAAQYAIDNVKSDWNANALAKAKDYQSQQSLSPAAIREQLTSANGEKFTAAEADYAIQHLND